ncbi:hypothetical protein O3297_09345 [Janthinobacterium sp. SUN128]|uniref:hypothetical protein n=1 Tax=Janthinobacterium sp. SUN128 TaxID=3014790 RepID=UPI00271436F7|nr:hypothetical protein [Janthinobacterium sp. SUN128]MDO8033619.1 hypothetical protein [Janthinobacterium sp. SUN128]
MITAVARALSLVTIAAAPMAHAETWQCADAASGRAYTVSQAVPADACKLVSSTKNPHSSGTAPRELEAPAVQRESKSCSKAAAQDVRKMMSEFAKWELGSDTSKIKVTWNHKTDSQSVNGILRLMTAFADADACIMGYPREIRFYRLGKQEGIASPDYGIKLTN